MKASVKVEILGLDETLNAIEKKYGKTRMNKAKREALEVSARYAAVMLKQLLASLRELVLLVVKSSMVDQDSIKWVLAKSTLGFLVTAKVNVGDLCI